MGETRGRDQYQVEGGSGPGSGPGAAPAKAGAAGFSARSQDGVEVITFQRANILDAYEIEQMGNEIYRHIKSLDPPRLVVDLANVEHLSSAALGMFIALRKVVVEKKGGALCLANVTGDLQAVFKMTNLHKLIKLHDTLDKAIGSVK